MVFIKNTRGPPMNIYTVKLTEDEHEALCELASKGKHNSQKILNALILLIVITDNINTS
jgi:hypothetical protein